jgi:alkanesulfonate monooxygenase SsuD/methylene tetrahydromethanopterin reductase-like flavin-dependent oxidoreductase (luciferase family)
LIEQKFEARQAAQTIDMMIESGLVLCGSPATVREQILEAEKRFGIGTMIAMLQVATLPRDLTEKNLRLFAGEVMPALRASTVAAGAGA